MKKRWYLESWVIAIMFALWFVYFIPSIIGIVLLILRKKQDKFNLQLYETTEQKLNNMIAFNEQIGFKRYEDVTNKIAEIETDFSSKKESLELELQSLKNNREQEKENLLSEVKDERNRILSSIDDINRSFQNSKQEKEKGLSDLNSVIAKNNEIIIELNNKIDSLHNTEIQKEKQIKTQIKKISRIKELYQSITYAVNNFFDYIPNEAEVNIPKNDLLEAEQITPCVSLKLHSLDVKDLRKAFKDNDKHISEILDKYSSRYTTKSNIAIYKLMVIALRSELQNILYNLKYEKLDDSIQQVKNVTSKYLKIAGDGNQSIVGTLTKFIGQMEYLFINAVKIEYNYYVRREQAKQEQKALREQMRQEAAERKALEAERKKIEQEESKYNSEIQKLNKQLSDASEQESDLLKSRILELESQLANVIVKKEEIATLAQGKAGNVYIISNVGSFGENIFKIGMTRRLEPQDRVDELGSASVPFKFDVHSFIFSDDAVALENKLHEILNNKRVNKVNMRKEFFKTSIDELEQIVNDIDPTAEFKRTILAEEYRQSLSEEEISNSSLLSNTIKDAI